MRFPNLRALITTTTASASINLPKRARDLARLVPHGGIEWQETRSLVDQALQRRASGNERLFSASFADTEPAAMPSPPPARSEAVEGLEVLELADDDALRSLFPLR